MKRLIQYLRFLYRRHRPVQHSQTLDVEREEAFMAIHRQVAPYTVTSLVRQYALYKAVEHVTSHGIDGDFVECGVFRGGSTMLAALAFRHFGADSRRLMLFDTFAGMSCPTEHDQRLGGVENGSLMKWRLEQRETHNDWCYCSLEEVRQNMALTGYEAGYLHYVMGKVEDTLPGNTPERIAILRLDTDFYESTRAEMVHLYPRLASGGILILDDYGLWQGSRKAVDDYFMHHPPAPFLVRVDKAARVAVKP